ncbi:flagellar hook-basal body complex protein FliE [Pseudoruegeria sp. SK021]|uniref:flagellar hook-basal body complex protein FliE n=1 Tax=Pseudoruegeria sp. SK021 TaxID=1933035 RepID=UPI000A2392E2|nr:flagellar hook-basal body complex protein FliE [Pseudoruegeria sp. SK021]OSP54746.1 flagellar hook-basal body protein FliE [Pseudoruegeria sp. SK021]
MDIKSTFAAQNYAKARPATEPEPSQGGASGLAGQIATDFTATLRNAEATAEAALVGKADPHALVEALAQSQLAVETAVTVRDKVVEAYQEILRMPV